MEPLTLFTWGYWGWGSATDQLIRAVDTVEASRGFKPPLFVDIRISRSVRAPGFDGHAFEKAVGASRYRWLDSLGNVAIKEGGPMRIKDPAAATTLLDIAEGCARAKQRVLFFCSCEFPGNEGHNCCHRTMVARLVLEAAERGKRPTQVVEWPGGEPILEGLGFDLTSAEFAKLSHGAVSIPLGEPDDLAFVASIPWCSLLIAQLGEDGGTKDGEEPPQYQLLTGPARYKKGGWYLPTYKDIDPALTDDEIRHQMLELREGMGFQMRSWPRNPSA